MTVINPEHLLAQARALIAPAASGARRQVDLRRAISSAYYSVFHRSMAALADQFVGSVRRGTPEYGLAYRATSHAALKQLCADLKKPTPPQRYSAFVPAGGMGPDFTAYAAAVVDLQERRHTADYDPSAKILLADAKLAIITAESAMHRYDLVPGAAKLTFLTLLAFRTRDDT